MDVDMTSSSEQALKCVEIKQETEQIEDMLSFSPASVGEIEELDLLGNPIARSRMLRELSQPRGNEDIQAPPPTTNAPHDTRSLLDLSVIRGPPTTPAPTQRRSSVIATPQFAASTPAQPLVSNSYNFTRDEIDFMLRHRGHSQPILQQNLQNRQNLQPHDLQLHHQPYYNYQISNLHDTGLNPPMFRRGQVRGNAPGLRGIGRGAGRGHPRGQGRGRPRQNRSGKCAYHRRFSCRNCESVPHNVRTMRVLEALVDGFEELEGRRPSISQMKELVAKAQF